MKKMILIAEDSPTELLFVAHILEGKGYQIITAIDGEDAIEKADSNHPQLAIIDIVMPKKNGFQVTRQLKTSPQTNDIKVLLLSSKRQESDRFWGMKQGADDYLEKPFNSNRLLEIVERLI